jgi:hypothetical protein
MLAALLQLDIIGSTVSEIHSHLKFKVLLDWAR